MAWFILMSDYDVEGIAVYGPFTSEKAEEMVDAEEWADGEIVEYDLTLEQVQYLYNEAYEPLVEKDHHRAQPRRTYSGTKKRQKRRAERHEARRQLKFI